MPKQLGEYFTGTARLCVTGYIAFFVVVVAKCLVLFVSLTQQLILIIYRIRKKARYQELLDCETRFKDFSQSEQIKNERCLVLQKFLKLRESMVRTITANSNDTSHKENYPSPPENASLMDIGRMPLFPGNQYHRHQMAYAPMPPHMHMSQYNHQSALEAARFGAKIIHGPYTDNFKDVYRLLKFLNASKKIKSSKELASSIKFTRNKNIGNKIKFIGEKILKKTIKELDSIITDDVKKT